MALTVKEIEGAPPKKKPYKIFDGKGLYLLVNKTGKYFRYDYRFAKVQKTLALGVYDETSLKEAREKHIEARRLLMDGIDPSAERKAKKQAGIEATQNTFERVAMEWFDKFSKNWTKSHSEKLLISLKKNVFPYLGARPISDINAPEILSVLRKLEAREAIYTAHRIKQRCGQIFRYAIATGRAERDPAADLKGALAPVKEKHFATLTDEKKIGELLRAIDDYEGYLPVKFALRLAPLLFVRPGELRHAEWSEFTFNKENPFWRIPAEKMKMRVQHLVPLAPSVISILMELKKVTGEEKYLFPSVRTSQRPMSNNTITGALRRLGFTKEEITGHGFRAMASTILHEKGWNSDVIERQLAHRERNKMKETYDHSKHLPERREMMIFWAEYLEKLKKGK